MQSTTQNKTTQKVSRKEEILQALAKMLQNQKRGRITTATLAQQVGVSEAALYRHYPSKAKIYEALIEFIEETLFTRINLILKEQESTLLRCEHILTLVLAFAEQNPGLCRLLTGDALVEEEESLRLRITRLFERVETQIKQVLRESEIREGTQTRLPTGAAASMLTALVEGRIVQFVRSEFKRSPTSDWSAQWAFISQQLLIHRVSE